MGRPRVLPGSLNVRLIWEAAGLSITAVPSDSVSSRLSRLRALTSDESEPGVGFLSSERGDDFSGVERNQGVSPRDTAVFDRVRYEVHSASGTRTEKGHFEPHPKCVFFLFHFLLIIF